MKNSEFWRNMDHEFGSGYSHMLADSLALTELGSLNATQALRKGIKPKQVWEAICRAQDVPPERWLGMDIEPKEA
ncbi:DUF3046 domain-containing protein [Arthrobacter sp. MYb211]|uniref:DUF3046 domain-containing protein n=1 Tax=Micrococcaceae TaxID=1268 RepID=UPI000BB6851F|nr:MULTISPECIES: DUF3046 domain-containing protein [Micrococcaceae]PCC27625.1 histidine kinase [Glutamicibacter sp. BW80]PQZ96672.1 DUF3046 domain-containing protein [Arthrobacter sp. MYb224]PRA01901.1 DUF3046 domain-containing protein [Arthrobacter sp. MYb229]PRA13078.1 DUF3046 domain-containing protein [Arthrobacter sp. MYb221]PRB50410.1 DUF3046 domain-containing protein [Arthrobacter sp. MYb216]